MRTRAATGSALIAFVLAAAGCDHGDPVPGTFWTVQQAESIRTVRGTPLARTECSGLREGREERYGRFSCVGVTWPPSTPQLKVRVRYVLDPAGPYRGTRSAYLATNVHFDSFGVP
jgi:hypothetical protein